MFTRNFDIMQLNMDLGLSDSNSVSTGTNTNDWTSDNNYNVIKATSSAWTNQGTTPYYCRVVNTLYSTTYTTGLMLGGSASSSSAYMFPLIRFESMLLSSYDGSGYYYNGCCFGTNSSAESYDDYRIDMIPNNSTNGLYFTTPTVTYTTENGKKYANITINANNRTGSDLSVTEFGIYTTRPTYLSSTSSSYKTSVYILLYRKVFSAVTVQAGANFEFKDKIELKDYEGSNIGVSPSCVLTRNYYKMLDWYTYCSGKYGTVSTAPTESQWTSSDDYDCVKALNSDGTSSTDYKYQWISKHNVSYGSSNYTYMNSVLTDTISRLILGSGSTAPTYNDADLVSRLVTYNRFSSNWSNYQYSYSGSQTKSISGDTMVYNIVYTITNTSDSNITIREYGLYNYYVTKSQYNSSFLTLRGVLPSDITLEPSAVTTITLSFSIPIRPNKPA